MAGNVAEALVFGGMKLFRGEVSGGPRGVDIRCHPYILIGLAVFLSVTSKKKKSITVHMEGKTNWNI